ncbi:BON domain-containing protein [Desulfobulbus elongatus]|uniref:BON domain-containing protein n=1 Tax=Desulfobulbus elongatus TaxID=53332 RepID=UPI0004822A37|nr:BON domain-containing protein [Desulfobulbus elongatus]
MERNSVRVGLAFLLAVLLSFAVSCTTPAGRSAGDVVDDATITTEVKAALLADKEVSGLAVSVQTFKGEVVLTGAVDSQTQVKRAEKIARSVKGVSKVKNLLKIK